jgi:hypothetical protein
MSQATRIVVFRRCKSGATSFWGVIYQPICPCNYSTSVSWNTVLGSFEDAEDMLPETLVRAWKPLDSVKGRPSLRAWLYHVAFSIFLEDRP